MSVAGERLTYCTVGRLGFIPVVGREVVESAEDVLAGDTCEGGWRVGTRDESGGGGRRGHGYLDELAGTGRVWIGTRCYKSIGTSYCPGGLAVTEEEGANRHVAVSLYTKGGTHNTVRSPDRYCFGSSEPLPGHNPSR